MKLLPEPGYSSVKKYCDIFGTSKPTYYRGVKAGTQPKAHQITEGRVGIPNCDINERILRLQEEAAQGMEDAREVPA
jgi:predicted DNA-binding transcriptional regulator AlpA